MFNVAGMRDSGALTKCVYALGSVAVTAGGAGDAAAINGASINLLAYAERFRSAKIAVAIAATQASGQTASAAVKWQDSADNSNWSDYGDALASTVVLTGPSGGGANNGCLEYKVNCEGARQYLRAVVTPDLNRAGTDTAVVTGVYVLGGPDKLPIT